MKAFRFALALLLVVSLSAGALGETVFEKTFYAGGFSAVPYDSRTASVRYNASHESFYDRSEYDENGLLLREVALDSTVIQESDDYGRLIQESSVVLYDYDENGRLLKKTTVDIAEIEIPESSNYLLKASGSNTDTYLYGEDGSLSEIQRSNGVRRIFENGLQTATIQASGEEIRFTYEYDASGSVVKRTSSLGSTIDYEYDDRGNLIRKADSSSGTTTYEYDDLNRLTKEIYKGENNDTIDTYTYEEDGCMILRREIIMHDTADEPYQSICYYDPNGYLVKEVFDGYAEEYEYDSAGRRTKLTSDYEVIEYNAKGGITRAEWLDLEDCRYEFEYYEDGVTLRTSHNYYESLTDHHDENGDVIREVFDNGSWTEYQYQNHVWYSAEHYDANGEPQHFEEYYMYGDLRGPLRKSGSSPNAYNEFDEEGNLIKMAREDGSYVLYEVVPEEGIDRYLEYDAQGNLVDEW